MAVFTAAWCISGHRITALRISTPNLAQVPNPKKGKPLATECRSLFRLDNDWVFVTCDQAGLQDRAFAHYLAEFDGGAYARDFVAGMDTHWNSVLALGLVPAGTARDKENKFHAVLREGAKAFRYGFLFGAQAKRAGIIIRDTIRNAMAVNPSSDLLRRFFSGNAHPNEQTLMRVGGEAKARFEAATPGLRQLRESLQRQANQYRWLHGLDGRRIPVRALYTVLNYAVTSAEAIICKWWLTRVFDELQSRFRYGWNGDVVIVAWTHDEIACCCRPEIAEQVGEIMVRYAKAAGEHFGFKCSLDADFAVGKSWAGEISTNKPAKIASPVVHIEEKHPRENVIERTPPCEPLEEHGDEAVVEQGPIPTEEHKSVSPPPGLDLSTGKSAFQLISDDLINQPRAPSETDKLLAIARNYVKRGWNPIPVSRQTKRPVGTSWQHRRLSEETVATVFNRVNLNIGVQLGPMSGGLTDIDLDCREAVTIGPMLLPTSNNVFGRASKPRSHWLYMCTSLAEKNYQSLPAVQRCRQHHDARTEDRWRGQRRAISFSRLYAREWRSDRMGPGRHTGHHRRRRSFAAGTPSRGGGHAGAALAVRRRPPRRRAHGRRFPRARRARRERGGADG